jgi:hypothetical protein
VAKPKVQSAVLFVPFVANPMLRQQFLIRCQSFFFNFLFHSIFALFQANEYEVPALLSPTGIGLLSRLLASL